MGEAPEFSRRIALDRLGPVPHPERIEATEVERAKLARRFGWSSIEALSAEATLTVRAGGIDAEGVLRAALAQPCVVTGDPVPAVIDQPFNVRFAPAEALAVVAEEVELSADDLDVMEHDGQAIDLGEAVSQTLALTVDPFPRSRGCRAQRARR